MLTIDNKNIQTCLFYFTIIILIFNIDQLLFKVSTLLIIHKILLPPFYRNGSIHKHQKVFNQEST